MTLFVGVEAVFFNEDGEFGVQVAAIDVGVVEGNGVEVVLNSLPVITEAGVEDGGEVLGPVRHR